MKPADQTVTQVMLPYQVHVHSVPRLLPQLRLSAVDLNCHGELQAQAELAAAPWCCCYLAADLQKEFQYELPEKQHDTMLAAIVTAEQNPLYWYL